jgi:glucosylglycerate synthase
MADLESLSPQLKDRLAHLAQADVVIAVPGATTRDALQVALGRVRAALNGVGTGAKAVLLHPDGAMVEPPAADGQPGLLPFPIMPVDRFPGAGENLTEAYRTIFLACARLGARACVVVGSDSTTLSPEALQRLLKPIVEQEFDLVAPCYLRRRFDALLNSSVVAPLSRALYGKRLRFPVGADFGFSARLVERQLQTPAERGTVPVWFASDAACGGFKIGQAQLGLPVPVQRDPPDVSAAVAQLLGPVFQEVERNAACWQKVRASQPVPTFGLTALPQDETAAVEVSRMIEAFRLGFRNLPDVWGAVLPPATLVELKRLTQLPVEAFRLSDDVWARIVYDFVLAFRLRVMSRDHVLGALTPLYRAWVASYATEVRSATPAGVEQRLERLGTAFEAQKPYFVSRWRWPDRFNP